MSKTTAYYNQVYNQGYRAGLEAGKAMGNNEEAERVAFTYEGMKHILATQRGYYRLGKGGSEFYARWKWVAPSPLGGYYTFRSGSDLLSTLDELYDVVLLIEAGKAKASLDKPRPRS